VRFHRKMILHNEYLRNKTNSGMREGNYRPKAIIRGNSAKFTDTDKKIHFLDTFYVGAYVNGRNICAGNFVGNTSESARNRISCVYH